MKKLFLFFSLLFLAAGILSAAKQGQISVKIKQASDDIEEWLDGTTPNATDYNSSDLELGVENTDGTNKQLIALRFADVAIGKNRVITSANIEFELDATSKTTDPFKVYIWAEDADSTATFNGSASVPNAVSSRVRLTDSIEWSIPAGDFNTVDMKYKTSNIAPLVQQLVNRANWKAGNAITFFIKGTGTREVESYEGEASAAAKLYVSYEMTTEDSIQFVADSIQHVQDSIVRLKNDSIINSITANLVEADYTIPSWTLFKRQEIIAKANADTMAIKAGIAMLEPKENPYCVNMAINGDPKSQIGFTWYTNLGQANGRVEIIAGEVTDTTAFQTTSLKFNADTLGIRNLNYNVSSNSLSALAGITSNTKHDYTSHKALANGLTPNTKYSYRVGFPGAWSEVGTFTTAAQNEDFSFFYIADTQANNDSYFETSRKTIAAAKNTVADAKFCLITGDLVETSGSTNSEWEWEQWFQTNKPVWKNTPIAPICGNHDKSANRNLTNHFNTQQVGFDQAMSTTPGSVYSFVYGDALFIACSTEDYSKAGYLDSLKNYIRKEVAAHPEVKWKIAFYHKTVYTGSNSHQSDSDGKTVREALVPVFDEVGIDLALQGHDHIYEVIGVTRNFALVGGAVTNVDSVSTGGVRENMTGKQGGVFNVNNGTLFFLNNSAGKKKYEPRTKDQMDAAFNSHKITNYWGMFTGKFGQTGEPTFSDVKVTSDTIFVKTYTVDDAGVPTEYDAFKVVKSADVPQAVNSSEMVEVSIYPNPSNTQINVAGIEVDKLFLYNMDGALVSSTTESSVNVSALDKGVYMLKILSADKMFVEQVIVK